MITIAPDSGRRPQEGGRPVRIDDPEINRTFTLDRGRIARSIRPSNWAISGPGSSFFGTQVEERIDPGARRPRLARVADMESPVDSPVDERISRWHASRTSRVELRSRASCPIAWSPL